MFQLYKPDRVWAQARIVSSEHRKTEVTESDQKWKGGSPADPDGRSPRRLTGTNHSRWMYTTTKVWTARGMDRQRDGSNGNGDGDKLGRIREKDKFMSWKRKAWRDRRSSVTRWGKERVRKVTWGTATLYAPALEHAI